jgi:phage terminase large subunit GpA-like protein
VMTEPYELDTDPAPDYNMLYDRREAYKEHNSEIILPAGVMLLTVGADVQRDRIEAEILGTGFDGETWGVEYRSFYGSTELPAVYKEFDAWSQKRFRHESGHWLWSACTCIDAGFKSESVYRYVKSCRRKVFAVRGIRGFAPIGSAWVDRSTSDNERLWLIKVDGPKESLYSRLRLNEPGPGFQHFPNNAVSRYDEEFFRQLTVEIVRTSPSGQTYFAKPNAEARNEALDIRTYCSAAVEILKPDWARVKASLDLPPQNDWRDQREKIKIAAMELEIPDLRGVEVPKPADLELSSLAAKVDQGSKRWMNFR